MKKAQERRLLCSDFGEVTPVIVRLRIILSLLYTAPKRRMTMQKYSHSMIRQTAARLPYMADARGKCSR